MRKMILMVVLVSLLTLTMSGCFGQFVLTRKVYEFNQTIDNPFVRSILFWVMNFVPVYGVAVWVDVVILNLLEFWTGANPLAMNEGEFESQIYVYDGVDYEVIASKNRFDITEVGNPENTFALVFDAYENSWNLHKNGQEVKITQQEGKELKLFNFDGEIFASMISY